MLPGADLLAAALAAGETPSPKVVADAPVEGSLSPAIALGLVLLRPMSQGGLGARVEEVKP